MTQDEEVYVNLVSLTEEGYRVTLAKDGPARRAYRVRAQRDETLCEGRAPTLVRALRTCCSAVDREEKKTL